MQNIRQSLKTGLSFGLTSGSITTLGLMVGLHSGTHSKMVVLGGILFIAIADAMSDALGIHIAEESRKLHIVKEVWEATIYTFCSKFLTALSFIIPLLLLPLYTAIIVNVLWGLFVIAFFSFFLAKQKKAKPYVVILEHLAIAVVVIITTHLLGDWISAF